MLALSAMSSVHAGVNETSNYTNNRYPLVQKPYMELPLVYALRMEEEWKKKELEGNETRQFGNYFYEVTSPTPWNYAIHASKLRNPAENFTVIIFSQFVARNRGKT